jgi:hypothetical protein
MEGLRSADWAAGSLRWTKSTALKCQMGGTLVGLPLPGLFRGPVKIEGPCQRSISSYALAKKPG